MDWNNLNSIAFDELKDAEKDELFGVITWYNCENDADLTLEKCLIGFKLAQETLKYKGEQVETLLAELDEIAIKEAEQEDLKSVKSKRSQSSLEIDDLEEKVKDLKHKLKHQTKMNEKQRNEMEKLQNRLLRLEDENQDLRGELRVFDKDDSQSDISETIKDQHKDLIDSIHEKNKQISQLLDDIEHTERENVVLKEKTTALRDELIEATSQLTIESNLTKSLKEQNDEQSEKIRKQQLEIEALKDQVQELEEERSQHNAEVERFKTDVDAKIQEWMALISSKNDEIQRLKNQRKVESSNSPSIVSEECNQEMNVLTKVVNEREEKILELQDQLQIATKDIEDNTRIIEDLKRMKTNGDSKMKELAVFVKDLKKQLKTSHNRCQEIQDNLNYAEELLRENETRFNNLTKKLADDGQIDIADILKLNRTLTAQNLQRDKQVEELVKTSNKLQHALDAYERENLALRSKLGLPEDGRVAGINAVVAKQQKQNKLLKQLLKQNGELEEEKIALKLKNKELSLAVVNLCEQKDPTVCKNVKLQEEETREGIETEGAGNYKEIVDENAALRKGLHEILDKLHSSEGAQEIKIDTLEKLLRALDVRHVSGWYHPAMRLQAELHALEGTNSELREQLRLARLELSKYMESPRSSDYPLLMIGEKDFNNSEIIANLNSHLLTVLSNYKVEETTNKALKEKIEEYRNEFSVMHQQVVMLYKQYADETNKFHQQDKEFNRIKLDLLAKVDDLEKELDLHKDLSQLSQDEAAKKEKILEMASKIVTLNRKCIYLENLESELCRKIKSLEENLLNSETCYISKVNKLDAEKQELLCTISKIETMHLNTCNKADLTKLQDEFDRLTIEHRELLKTLTEIQENHRREFEILKQSNDEYKKEKEELNGVILETFNKLHIFEESSCNVDGAVQSLTRKLAQSEVNEISERQRGNHINNLYELVKEQLKKSEDRFTEFEKFNKEIMRKNLELQENVKDLQDKLVHYVDFDEVETLKRQHEKLLDENKLLSTECLRLKEVLMVSQSKDDATTLWNSMKEYELLNLKHQIVDLQSNSDEKAIIARLSSDVINARLAESECRNRIESLRLEAEGYEADLNDCKLLLNEERAKNDRFRLCEDKKIGELHQIIKQQRSLYYGSVPLISETHFINALNKAHADKHRAFLSLRQAQEQETESNLLKTQLQKHLNILDELKSESSASSKILQWYQEKKNLQLQELRYKRHAEFKDNQLKQALNRITIQDDQIERLETDILLAYQKPELFLDGIDEEIKEDAEDTVKERKLKMFRSQEAQTSIDLCEFKDADSLKAEAFDQLQTDLMRTRAELTTKEKQIEDYKSKLIEMEMNISLFKTQLGDKQSQITFYENHILELKSKLEVAVPSEKIPVIVAENVTENVAQIGAENSAEEISSLKANVAALQLIISQKEENITSLQSLLKKDRDEHSLAAARTQNELKKLHDLLNAKDSNDPYQSNLPAIEQYVRQVHALEQHTTELHGSVSTLNGQLLASHEELLHWKTLANERLQSIDAVRSELTDKYQKENALYKNECEKWRSEIRKLNNIISSYRESANEVKIDITQLLKDKDDEIHRLTNALRRLQKEMNNLPDVDVLMNEHEEDKRHLRDEYETLKKRFDLLMAKDKKSREEIRTLRAQLIKRPALSARSDRSDSSREQQLIKRASNLEKEVEDLREKLDRQVAINESHRVKVDEDFEKWNKQKQWQQTAEKFRTKLKERNDDYDKLQHTCAGYRILIERLEREKYALENRMKVLKNRNNNNTNPQNNHRVEALEADNVKLLSQIEMLTAKLDVQQRHAGGLAAALMQEKLEAQERKIAILEVSSKCPLEVRTEMERLHSSLANLQKRNLQLEAQNMEINFDLQKCRADTPHLKEQIQYLESYIEVLKSENVKHEIDNSGDHLPQKAPSPKKKVSELERTVFVLKRLVEKLQAENKRLNSTGNRLCAQNNAIANCSADVLRNDYQHLKEQYGECVQKNARLERELNTIKSTSRAGKNKSIAEETLQTLALQLNEAKMQLAQKSELLDKVKVLLHRAASREKALNDEIAALRQNASENQSVHSA